MNSEIVRRHADTEKVLALVRAREGQTLYWMRFFAISKCAWRTRISEARAILCKEQGLPWPIPKGGRDPLAWNHSVKRSGYRYQSNPLGGRDATVFPDASDTWSAQPGRLPLLDGERSGWQERHE